MKREVQKIYIIPARLIEKQNDGYQTRYLIRCLMDNVTEDRLFDSYSLDEMVNPKYLLIGIMTGVGYIQTTFVQADEFEKTFKEKWKTLIE